jgi:DNA helicase-2/ATP-dependent DNA helicase PcrA
MSSWNRPQFGMPAGRAPQRRFGTATARSDAAKKAKAGREIPSLDPGDRVQHDSFGLGTVVALEGAGDNSVASIDFGDEGVKRLLLRYAPVEKL